MQGRYAQLQKMLADAPVRSPLASPRDAEEGGTSGADGAMDNDERVVSTWTGRHTGPRHSQPVSHLGGCCPPRADLQGWVSQSLPAPLGTLQRVPGQRALSPMSTQPADE